MNPIRIALSFWMMIAGVCFFAVGGVLGDDPGSRVTPEQALLLGLACVTGGVLVRWW